MRKIHFTGSKWGMKEMESANDNKLIHFHKVVKARFVNKLFRRK